MRAIELTNPKRGGITGEVITNLAFGRFGGDEALVRVVTETDGTKELLGFDPDSLELTERVELSKTGVDRIDHGSAITFDKFYFYATIGAIVYQLNPDSRDVREWGEVDREAHKMAGAGDSMNAHTFHTPQNRVVRSVFTHGERGLAKVVLLDFGSKKVKKKTLYKRCSADGLLPKVDMAIDGSGRIYITEFRGRDPDHDRKVPHLSLRRYSATGKTISYLVHDKKLHQNPQCLHDMRVNPRDGSIWMALGSFSDPSNRYRLAVADQQNPDRFKWVDFPDKGIRAQHHHVLSIAFGPEGKYLYAAAENCGNLIRYELRG